MVTFTVQTVVITMTVQTFSMDLRTVLTTTVILQSIALVTESTFVIVGESIQLTVENDVKTSVTSPSAGTLRFKQ